MFKYLLVICVKLCNKVFCGHIYTNSIIWIHSPWTRVEPQVRGQVSEHVLHVEDLRGQDLLWSSGQAREPGGGEPLEGSGHLKYEGFQKYFKRDYFCPQSFPIFFVKHLLFTEK